MGKTAAPDSASVKLVIAGVNGRMGRRTQQRLEESSYTDFEWVGGIGSRSSSDEIAALLEGADVLLDWTAPAACRSLSKHAADAGVAYVLGSTGLNAEDERLLQQAASDIPILVSANFSIGVNMLARLCTQMASTLGRDADYEIFELHHGQKKDAPSGTAFYLGAALEEGTTRLHPVLGRAGAEPPRASDQLGYAAARGGDVAGEHTVFAMWQGERIELTHRATTPMIFVDGALKACRWVRQQSPGLYTMSDMLSL